MAWIKIVPPSEANGELQQANEDAAAARGKLARVVEVHGLNPRAMRAMMELYLAVMYGASPLSRAQREMMATAVSASNGCEYCVAHHAEAPPPITIRSNCRTIRATSPPGQNESGDR